MNIVRAGIDDVDRTAELFDLYRAFYEQDPDVDLARRFLRDRLENDESVVYLAEDDDDTPVGFMQLFPTFSSVSACRILILNDLYVVESHRGNRVGWALLQRAADHARDTGARRVVLSTAHSNTRAQGLYEAFGYELDTEFRHYSYAVEAG